MALPASQTLSTEQLDQALEAQLLGAPMPQGKRSLGIEVEYLILHREDQSSAPLAFCQQLLADLGGGEDYYFTMEPGGQLEIATPPRSCLAEIEPIMIRATAKVEEALATTEYALVSLGHAPVTKVSELGLLMRDRYQIMDAKMPARGKLTRNMMRATAGFQLTYDVQDRADAGRKMALLYRLVPVLLAISANSRMVEGKDSGYASFRHRVWWETDRERTGVPPGCLFADTAIDGYKAFARRATMLFFERDGGLVESPEQSLEELVAQGMISEDDLALHLTSLFPFVRLRNYLELRCLDAVEWPLARSILALISGLVYCKTATKKAEALSECLALEDAGALRELHLEVARDGLEARAPNGAPYRELAQELVGFAGATLGRKDCNWAMSEDLDAVTERLRG